MIFLKFNFVHFGRSSNCCLNRRNMRDLALYVALALAGEVARRQSGHSSKIRCPFEGNSSVSRLITFLIASPFSMRLCWFDV